MGAKVSDPYAVIIKQKKLPLSLLEDPDTGKGAKKAKRVNLVQTQPFSSTFGSKQTRKKPKLQADNYEELLAKVDQHNGLYEEKAITTTATAGGGAGADNDALRTGDEKDVRNAVRDSVFEKGQSKRIWGELYKVVDSSDVIIQVLDARDPMGTRCRHLENHLKKNARHKHLLLLLNKCDLVSSRKGWMCVCVQWGEGQ